MAQKDELEDWSNSNKMQFSSTTCKVIWGLITEN